MSELADVATRPPGPQQEKIPSARDIARRPVRAWIVSVAIGVGLGFLSLLSIGGVTLGAMSIGLCAWMTRREPDHRIFRLAMWALGLRWLLIIGITMGVVILGRFYIAGENSSFALFGDEGFYAIKSWWLLRLIQGLPLSSGDFIAVSQEFWGQHYGRSAHMYPMMYFYSLFGYSPAAVKGISALLGVVSGLLIYDMVLHISDRRAARIACLLVWFWPSAVLWSVTNLKDPYALFLTCLVVWAFQRWAVRRHLGYLAVLAVTLWVHASMKPYLWVFLSGAIVIGWLVNLRTRWLRRGLVICGMIALIGVVAMYPRQVDERVRTQLRQMAVFHIHQARAVPERSYRLLPDPFYLPPADVMYLERLGFGYDHAVRMLVLGVVCFLIIPFPWSLTSWWQLAALPVTFCWYGCLFLAYVGLRSHWRTRWRLLAFPLGVLVLLTAALAVTGGNIGTSVRHRDLVAPFYFMFAAMGLSHLWDVIRSRWHISQEKPTPRGVTPPGEVTIP